MMEQKNAVKVAGQNLDKYISELSSLSELDDFSSIESDGLNSLLTNYVTPEMKEKHQITNVKCPVCHKNYSTDIIEAHADLCAAERSTTNLYHTIDEALEVEDETSRRLFTTMDETVNRDVDLEKGIESENLKLALCGVQKKIGDEHTNIMVLRGNLFEYFHKFFSKTWNSARIGTRYIIKFIGEDGIDDGGLSKDFYYGMYNISPVRPN